MSYTIYKIDTFEHENNSYRVDREESWTLKKETEFKDLEDAKEYVRRKNRIFSDLPNYLIGLNDENKQLMIDEFCFSDKYMHLRKFFLGKPDINKIKNRLEQQGIKVLKVK